MATEQSGVYRIRNRVNGKVAIGSATNISKRINAFAQTPAAKRARAEQRRTDRTLGQQATWEIACQIRQRYGDPREHRVGTGAASRPSLLALARASGRGRGTLHDIVH